METRARALLAAGNVAAGLSCRITPGQNLGSPDRSVPVRRARRLERNDARPLLAVSMPGCGSVRSRFRSAPSPNVQRLRRRSCVPIPVPPPGMWALPHRPLLPSGLRDYPKTVLVSSHDAPTNPGCVMLIQPSALPGRFTSEVRHSDLEALTRPSSAQRYSPDFSTATR